jgi:hypothetical protein
MKEHSQSTVQTYSDDSTYTVEAWAYQSAQFRLIGLEDAEENTAETERRQVTDWTWNIQTAKPDPEYWKQTDETVHELQNITPLVIATADSDRRSTFGYYLEYESFLTGEGKTEYTTHLSVKSTAIEAKKELVPPPKHHPVWDDVDITHATATSEEVSPRTP